MKCYEQTCRANWERQPGQQPHLECECAKEAGNVWFAEPEPVELSKGEAFLIHAFITVMSVASIAILVGAAGWICQAFPN